MEAEVTFMTAPVTFPKPVDFSGVKIAIHGVGSVGHNMARILHEAGAKLVIADIKEENVENAVKEFGAEAVTPEEILSVECDILAPCALGGVINTNLARNLKCKILCGAANNVLDDPDEDSAILKSVGIVYAPDFVANAGGAIALAALEPEARGAPGPRAPTS